MRRRMLAAGLWLIAGLTLAACAPSSLPPRSAVARAIRQIRSPSPASPSPDEADRTCLEAYAEHADDLPAEFINQAAEVDPVVFARRGYYPVAETATDALNIHQDAFSLTTSNLPSGSYAMVAQWCAPYGSYDVFVAKSPFHLMHVLTIDSARQVNLWVGEDTLLIWTTAGGSVLHTQQVWIAERQPDDTWLVVYETTRVTHSGSDLPERSWAGNNITLDYTLSSGERVSRRFQHHGSGWALVDENRTDP